MSTTNTSTQVQAWSWRQLDIIQNTKKPKPENNTKDMKLGTAFPK